VKVASERIAATLPLDESAMTVMGEKRSAPRVAFGLLVESGMVPPGSILTDSKRRWSANVNADGSIACDGQAGSIHKIGAALQGAPSCIGWTFWHVEPEGKLRPIDAVRQAHLAGHCATLRGAKRRGNPDWIASLRKQ
jgi:modification methylase